MKILIAAGGSGGHLLPAQQLARDLAQDADIFFAGLGLDRSPFFDQNRFSYQAAASAPLKLSPKGLFAFLSASIRGFSDSFRLIRRFQPDIVVGFGSYHVFPVLLASAVLRRKLVLFEANCLLGKVNRLFAPYAKIVASQFLLKDERKNGRLVPLLPWNAPPDIIDKSRARALLGLESDRPVFLIFGGSQGAAFLNRAIPPVLPKNAQAIHLAGNEEAAEKTKERYRNAGVLAVVKSFEKNMPLIYAAADFAICRSGAGAAAELIRYQMPALLIPFPFASDDHQSANAEFLAKKILGATMLRESAADADAIKKAIDRLRHEGERMRKALSIFFQECEGRTSLRDQILRAGKSL